MVVEGLYHEKIKNLINMRRVFHVQGVMIHSHNSQKIRFRMRQNQINLAKKAGRKHKFQKEF